MGTRGSIGFRIDQKDMLFYNHHDSYPEELGRDTVTWVQVNIHNMDAWREVAKGFVGVSMDDKPTEAQKARARELNTINLGVSLKSEDDFYCLTRETQGDLTKTLQLGFGIVDNKFVHDSLFCEYAYIINFDTGELEFYKGFNKNPQADGRYAQHQNNPENNETQAKYYGVALVGTAPFAAIPEDWQARFYPESDDD